MIIHWLDDVTGIMQHANEVTGTEGDCDCKHTTHYPTVGPTAAQHTRAMQTIHEENEKT